LGNMLFQPNRTFSVQLTGIVDPPTPASFTIEPSFATGSSPRSVAVADINADGKPDLIVANSNAGGSGSVSVLTNHSTVNVTSFARQDFATGTQPVFVAVADLNGDGKPDLIVANSNPAGSGSVSVLLNATAPGAPIPSFYVKQDFATGTRPVSVAVVGLNGDGKPDLIVAYAGGGVSVL